MKFDLSTDDYLKLGVAYIAGWTLQVWGLVIVAIIFLIHKRGMKSTKKTYG